MKPTTEEITWVDSQLLKHNVKYQEVYDELKDHLLTGIENLKAQGDERHIEVLFKEVLSTQFPGWWPFDDIVKQYEAAYRSKIRKSIWANFKHYLNWQTIPGFIILIVSGFYLPQNKAVMVTLMVALLVIALVPLCYIVLKVKRVKAGKVKKSLVQSMMMTYGYHLLWIFSIIFNVIAAIPREIGHAQFLNPLHYPLVIYMLMFSFYIVYGLSCIRLCRQEFKIV